MYGNKIYRPQGVIQQLNTLVQERPEYPSLSFLTLRFNRHSHTTRYLQFCAGGACLLAHPLLLLLLFVYLCRV